MDKKTFFIDLDGTLLTKAKIVTEETCKSLRRAAESGHKIVICTGRSVHWFPRYVQNTPVRYVIGSSGAHIYDLQAKKSIYGNPLDAETLIKAVKAAQRPGVYFHFSAETGVYATERTREDISAFRYTTYLEEDVEKWLRKNKVYQTMFISYDVNQISQVRDELVGQGLLNGESCMQLTNQSKAMTEPNKYPVNNYSFFEFNKGGCNKGVAVKKFCEMFNIPFEATVGIGDDLNDRRMFAAVSYKVAMKNAIAEIRELADRVIGSNENNGVAEFLEKFFVN